MQVYLHNTDKNGKSWVTWHQCWDAERFVTTQQERAAKEGGSVRLAGEDEYKKERNYKR